ncbi:MAG: phosphotransferase [Deltaproteobacteria bacterium]|nr:phosphotransferase [Deltaproteobacteria bacterium]MBW2416445.1 phosphotransferase [Deltaproteobacteria bacterium]
MKLSELTPEWLTAALRARGVTRYARVTSVEFERIGTFSNELWRLRLGYDGPEAGAPDSLVLKRSKAGGRHPPGAGFDNEIRFYESAGTQVPVRVPRLVFGSADAAGGGLLLLEEVTGVERISFMRGASLEHAQQALGGLARIHAHWWGRGDGLEGFPSLADAGFCARVGVAYDAGWQASRDYFVHAGHGAFVEIGDALLGRVAENLAPLAAPATLLHGDAHFENLPRVHAPDGRSEILFLDWPAARRGLASFDVAVFLVQSFPDETRREVEQSLVMEHARAVNAERDASWPDPWIDYRRGVLYWMVHMLQDAALTPGQPPWVVVDRYVAAAVDLRVGELIV